jgi:hypothetical protein
MLSKESKNSTTRRVDANTSGDCCKEKGRLFPFHVEQMARREQCRKQRYGLQALHKGENRRPHLPIRSHLQSGRVLALASVRRGVTLWEHRRLKRNPRDAPFPESWSSSLLVSPKQASRNSSVRNVVPCGLLAFEETACSFLHIHRVPPRWHKPSHDGSSRKRCGHSPKRKRS